MMRPWLTLGVCAALGCQRGGGEDAATEVPRVPVGTVVAALDTMTEAVGVVGRLAAAPGGSVVLTAPAPAVVRAIGVQLGASVAKGALLVDLDAPELETSARSAAAQAEIAERDAARQQELLKEGITSKRQADEKAAEATGARAGATAAAQLLARARVVSPIAGVVQRVAVHQGERVDAGTPLVEVIDASTLDLVAAVPASDLARVRVGAPALVRAEGAVGALPGRVQAIAPAVDSLTNAAQVVIRVPNSGRALRAGTGATGLVIVGARKRALVVPDSAIVIVGDALTVFVVGADSVAKARPVGVGTRRDGRAEILRGLAPGDRVVVSGAFGLSDGMKVIPGSPARP